MAENKGRDEIYGGAEEDSDDDENFITLEFDDNESIECEILGIFEVDGREYIALLPDDGSDDIFIYRYKEEEDSDSFELEDIEDDDEFSRVADEFEQIALEETEELDDDED